MGRPAKRPLNPTLLALLAMRRWNSPVNMVNNAGVEMLSKTQVERLWRKWSSRSQLLVANIAMNRQGNCYTFHLRLPPSLVDRLEKPEKRDKAIKYIQERIRKAFHDAGETKCMYWYAYENSTKDFGTQSPFRKRGAQQESSNGIVEPHIHGGFAISDPKSLSRLKKLLKKYVALDQARGLRCVEFRANESAGPYDKRLTIYRLIGPAKYASKNFAFQTLDMKVCHFVSLPLKQEAKATIRELLAKP